jgi:CPA2 family monovalent cation:H+ antiporter-2
MASPWLGKRVKDLAFHAMGVRVVNLRRSHGQNENVSDETELYAGDTLVMSGKSQNLAVAEEKLLRG